MTTNTLAATLREFADAFETGTRTSTGDAFYKLKDDAPAWMSMDSATHSLGVMHEIHCAVDGTDSPRLPDDWIYEHAALISGELADAAELWPDEVADRVSEIADGMVDIYNANRTAWLASSLANAELVNEAQAEYGRQDDAIGLGQYLALERIAYAILELCEARAEELEEDALDAADDASFAGTYNEEEGE